MLKKELKELSPLFGAFGVPRFPTRRPHQFNFHGSRINSPVTRRFCPTTANNEKKEEKPEIWKIEKLHPEEITKDEKKEIIKKEKEEEIKK